MVVSSCLPVRRFYKLISFAARIFFDIVRRSKVDCGLASIKDLRTNIQDDRMESFVLSETLKVRNIP